MVKKRSAKHFRLPSKSDLVGRTLSRHIERHLQQVKLALLQDLLENEQLLTNESWHRIAASILRFIPDRGSAKLAPAPRVQIFTFDPETRTLSLRGGTGASNGLMPRTSLIENTVPGILIERNLQGETMEYLLLNPDHAEYRSRYRHYEDPGETSSELVVALRHHNTICGVINIEHPRKDALSPFHVSILLDAAAFISPFVHYILSEGERQRVREAALLYIQSKTLKRLVSVYRHKMSQSTPLIRFALHELEERLRGHDETVNESLQEIGRLISQLTDSAKDFLSDLPTVTSLQPVEVVGTATRAISEFEHLQLPIEFTLQSDQDQVFVLASGLLHEHIYNLLQNAVHAISSAMRRGGIMRGSVFVTLKRTDDFDTRGVPLDGPRRVVIRIADNGVGIPTDFKTRIFEYGFTTKGEQGGTGYGLSAARDYARSLGGDLVFDNGINGATFAMILQEYTPRFHHHLIERPISPREE
jgi:signal transduction histidine kinase